MVEGDVRKDLDVLVEKSQMVEKTETFDTSVEGQQKGGVATEGMDVDKEKEPEIEVEIQVSEGDSRRVEDEFINIETTGLRRSPRINKGGPLPKGCFCSKVFSVLPKLVFTLYTNINDQSRYTTKSVNHLQVLNTYYDGTLNLTKNYVMTSLKNSDNDVYTFKDMLQQEDKLEFVKAMFEEIDKQNERGRWTIISRREIPRGHKTIMAIWSFKRKRYLDGRIKIVCSWRTTGIWYKLLGNLFTSDKLDEHQAPPDYLSSV